MTWLIPGWVTCLTGGGFGWPACGFVVEGAEGFGWRTRGTAEGFGLTGGAAGFGVWTCGAGAAGLVGGWLTGAGGGFGVCTGAVAALVAPAAAAFAAPVAAFTAGVALTAGATELVPGRFAEALLHENANTAASDARIKTIR
jgi:hypothetical protein